MEILTTGLDFLLQTLPGRLFLWVTSKVSGRIRRKINAVIAADIEVGSASSGFAGGEGQPTPLHISIELRSRTPVDLRIDSASLRLGFSSTSQTYRNISWSREGAEKPPHNLTLPDLDGKTDSNISIETLLPEWLYFLQADRRPISVTGIIQFYTGFGKVELPVDVSVKISRDEVEVLADSRAFFKENSPHREQDQRDT